MLEDWGSKSKRRDGWKQNEADKKLYNRKSASVRSSQMPVLASINDVEIVIPGCASGVPHFRVWCRGRSTAVAIESLEILGKPVGFRAMLWVRVWARSQRSWLLGEWKRVALSQGQGCPRARYFDRGYFDQAIECVEPCEERWVRVAFADGFCTEVDLTGLDTCNQLYAGLRDEAAFRQVSVSKWGGLEWPDGADLCPGMLRFWCEADEMASAGEAEAGVSGWILAALGLGNDDRGSASNPEPPMVDEEAEAADAEESRDSNEV